MDSKGLKVPASESDKLEASVLGCCFNEKAEHLPIKKRRLFRASLSSLNTTSSVATETVAASLDSSGQQVQPKPDASCLPTVCSTDADLCQAGSSDGKVDGKRESVKAEASEDKDICGISLAAVAECSNVLGDNADHPESHEAPFTVNLKKTIVKLANMSSEVSTAPFKDVASSIMDHSSPEKAKLDNSTPDESTLDHSCSLNQVTSKTENAAARDERLHWDLNTVMDAWEEPLECNNITYAKEEKNCLKDGNSDNISNSTLPVDLKSSDHRIEDSKLEECKPSCDGIIKQLSPVVDSAADSSVDAVPAAVHSTLTLQHPACVIPAKHVNVNHGSTDELSRPTAPGTGFSLDYSIPLGFKHSENSSSAKESVHVPSTIVGSGNNINHAFTTVGTIIKNEKHDLSLATVASLENEHQSGSTSDEDDKAKVKKLISNNGTELPQETDKMDCNTVNLTTFNLLVTQSPVVAQITDRTAVASSIKPEPISLTEPIHDLAQPHESHTDHVSSNKEACEFPLENGSGNETFQSDIQAGSEVDNVDEASVVYSTPYEDGELRESRNEHGKQNIGASFDLDTSRAHENISQSVPEESSFGSQRAAEETSSIILPEKPDGSDQVSGSGPDEASDGSRQVTMKDTVESDQWKMNVSGWDLLPDDRNTSNNSTNIRDLSGIKFSSRIQRYGSERKDMETKAESSRFYKREPNSRLEGPSARDAFLNRARLRLQGSSSLDAGDSSSRPIRESNTLGPIRPGKYTPYDRTNGRGMWNHSRSRSPGMDRVRVLNRLHSPPHHGPPFHRAMLEDDSSVDTLTNNPSINRQSFRTRPPNNREEDDFRARLGLGPSGETVRNRLVNVGRGRLLKYSPKHNDAGPTARVRYCGPGPESDDYNEPVMGYKYPHPFHRRDNNNNNNDSDNHNNHPFVLYRSDSISPLRSRTRSPIRSPFRSDTRMRRPRSPIYRTGFEDHVSEYSSEPQNSHFNYKQRRSPPLGSRVDPIYDSLRKTKSDEHYRFGRVNGAGRGGSGYGDVMDDGYRRGGFVRRYDMGRHGKLFRYDEEDGYGPVYDSSEKEGLEFRGRVNRKPFSSGVEGRFRDGPRRPRDERDRIGEWRV